MKFQAVVSLKADYPLSVLFGVAGLARSTFFYHQGRLRAPEPQKAIKAVVTEIFEKNHGRYGVGASIRSYSSKGGRSRKRPC